MSGARDLKQFLEQQSHPVARAAEKKEWQAAIAGLFKRLRSWLADLEKRKLLIVEERVHGSDEASMMGLELPSLRIRAPHGRHVDVVPKARFVIGGEGRVDLLAGARRVSLIRTADENWVVALSKPNAVAFHVVKLDKDVFSAQLKELLS